MEEKKCHIFNKKRNVTRDIEYYINLVNIFIIKTINVNKNQMSSTTNI